MYVMWKLVSVHLEIMLVSANDRCIIWLNVPWAWKSLWAHPMVLLCNVCQVKACFGPFGDILISAQDRCMVSAERTIGLETILDGPDGTPM
jgi:hypothetical protein